MELKELKNAIAHNSQIIQYVKDCRSDIENKILDTLRMREVKEWKRM